MNRNDKLTIDVTKSQLFDVEFIARAKKMKKEEWVQSVLLQEVQRTKELLLQQLEKDFVTGQKNKEDYEHITGFEPSAELEERRKQYETKMEAILRGVKHREFARKALLVGHNGNR